MLFAWQRELKRGSVDEEINNTGCWKKYENRLRNVDLKLASPLEADNMMDNLLLDFRDIQEPSVEDIARFHYRFELIHPFQDGNGRIGRFIILKQCIDHDIDLISIDDAYLKEYKNALYHAQKTDDISELVDVFIKCQRRLDEKMAHYENMLELVKNEVKNKQIFKKGGDHVKYNYRDYDIPLCDGMKNVEKVYEKYIKDQDNEKLYDELKEAVYLMSLDIKSARVCGQLAPAILDEMKEYYWGLLL